MGINSLLFAAFLLVVVVARWSLPRRARIPSLLAASYAFYAAWSPAYLLLLLGMTLFTFVLGTWIERTRHRRAVLALGVSGCLGVLIVFKYVGFFAGQAVAAFGFFGHAPPFPLPEFVLPLGISFYTFQMLSYLVDIFRGRSAERSLWRYALYVSFFPKLVAGPIVRADGLLPQLRRARRFDAERFMAGLDLLALGFFKKIVLADNLATWSDLVFASPSETGSVGVWVGVLAYAGQIYCDFSGYTDIARGAGRLLGVELPENFRLPYMSGSVREFWGRWHITLSSWLRDYLYIPLGGNRRGRTRRYVNLMVTMVLGGLWHGASLNFVAWGLFHGLLLWIHGLWRGLRGQGPRRAAWSRTRAYRWVSLGLTFLAVCLAWVLFRAETLVEAGQVFAGLVAMRPMGAAPESMRLAILLLTGLAISHLLAGRSSVLALYERAVAHARGLLWALSVLACYLMGSAGSAFIYLEF
jgi:alginate O-acetyltransferase complex protein AlgI